MEGATKAAEAGRSRMEQAILFSAQAQEQGIRFFKEVIGILTERMSAGGFTHLILAGEPGFILRIRTRLPKSLLKHLVDIVPAPGKDKTEDVVKTTLSAFIEEKQRESLSIVETLHGEIRTNGLGLSGERETLRALEYGQADVLVLAEGYDSEVREEMVRLAAKTGCEVEIVDQSDLLMQLGGVGCLLRYRIAGDIIDLNEQEVQDVPLGDPE